MSRVIGHHRRVLREKIETWLTMLGAEGGGGFPELKQKTEALDFLTNWAAFEFPSAE